MKRNEMKKSASVVFISSMILSMCGCAGSTPASATSAASEAPFSPKTAINIDEIDWQVENAVIDDERCMSLNYTNNSKYKILALQLECVVKEDTTLEQLQKLNDFRTSEKWTDAQLKKLTFDGENDKFAEPGESVADAECYLNDSYGNGVTKEMYDLFTPSMMKIAFVGPDEKGYDVTYDFIGDAYGTSSSEGIDLYTWSENELPALLPEPKDFVVTITSDKTDYFYAYVYGMKASDFKEYAVAAKEKGFNQDSQEINSDFYAKNADGQRLRLSYSEEKERMSIDLFQK